MTPDAWCIWLRELPHGPGPEIAEYIETLERRIKQLEDDRDADYFAQIDQQ